MTSDSSKYNQHQDHRISIGHDFHVEGQGHHINFSQTQIIQIAVDEIKTRPLVAASPYKGLKRFEVADRDRFFGRDQLIRSLAADLETSNLVLLLGASGSGKSSVVRAGLIPQLINRWGSQFLDIAFTPDVDPFESLYASLLKTFKQDQAKIARRDHSQTLVQTVKVLKPADQQWLILIDQFEELFTLTPVQKRKTFINALLYLYRALQQAEWRSVKLVLTMRADFLDRISTYPSLGRLIQGHMRLVTDMHRDELRLAIEQPAAHHGVVFEAGLVDEITNDVQGQAGSLPLLQYTLDLLWQREDIRDRTLNTQTYRELGGVRGALQQRVDAIYSGFDPTERVEAKQIFLKLVDVVGSIEEVDLAGRAISKRVSLMAFESRHERQVLQKLVDYNLLVSNREQQSTVEIAHEALISSWKTLQSWIDESKEVIIINNRLRDDAQRWHRLIDPNPEAAEEELWSGTKLDRVLELQKQHLFEITLGGLTEEERAFIHSSIERQQRLRQESEAREQRELALIREALAHEKRAAAEAQKAQVEERRARKAIQRVAIASIALLLAVIGGAGGIWWNWRQALLNQLEAEVASGIASPDLLPVAKRALKQGHQFQESDRLEDALAKYQLVRDYALKLQPAAIEPSPGNSDSTDVGILFNNATNAIIELVRAERLPELKRDLKAGKIGQRNYDYDVSQLENQYESGALKTTYLMAMRDTGADINDDGSLNGPEEANRIPCEVLRDIEKAWRGLTQNQCGWFGVEGTLNLEAPDCQQLKGQSLTLSIFDFQPYIAQNRMTECGISEIETSKRVEFNPIAFYPSF